MDSFEDSLIPVSVLLDNKTTIEAEAALQDLLAEITQATETCCEEEENAADYLPILSVEMMREWLVGAANSTNNPKPHARELAILAVQRIVLDFQERVMQMDSAVDTLLRGTRATTSTTILHVNLPDVLELLEDCPKDDNQVYMIVCPDFYDEPPQNDGRVDVLLSVVRWRGAALCRPTLVDLEKVEERLTKYLEGEKSAKRPTVEYAPQFGAH